MDRYELTKEEKEKRLKKLQKIMKIITPKIEQNAEKLWRKHAKIRNEIYFRK